MNKILNINLGGYALTIDDDAYEYLSNYLDSIRRRFSESEGRDEILQDIEARLGELMSAELGNRSIVMLPDVQAAVEVMGKPEDFGGEPVADTRRSSRGPGPIRVGKRLFRDEEDATAGGVCSGLSAYFGIADPVWLRLIFVFLTIFSGGTWIIVYLLLWVLVPAAHTAADRLAMRGEPANAENIAREVEHGFERLSHQVSERGFTRALSSIVTAIGRLFAFAVRFVAKFAALIAVLIVIGLLLFMVFGWIGGLWGMVVAAPFLAFFSPFSSGVTYLAFTNIFFLIGIPVIALCLITFRLMFKTRTPRWLISGMGLFWVINLICAIFLVGAGISGYRQSGSVSKTMDLSSLPSDTLRVEALASSRSSQYDEDLEWGDHDNVRLRDNNLEMSDMIHIRVRQSNSSQFEYSQVVRARGSSGSDAAENAASAEFETKLSGNTLTIPTLYTIPKGKKWRVQEIKITIGVPVGKYVTFGKGVNYRVQDVDYADPEGDYYIGDYPNKVFRMTQDGLACADCPAFGDKEYRDGRFYENFILEGKMNVEIRHADAFKMRVEGPADALEKIRTGDKLTLSVKGNAPPGLKVYIETPVFTSLVAENAGEVTIRGFEEGRASISAKGDTKVRAYLDVSGGFDVSLRGKSSLELTGKGSTLDAQLMDGSTLEAAGWRADVVELSASDASQARVFADDEAVIDADASSTVKVEGNGRVRKKNEE